jgi:serine/threonine protein kinase
LVEKKNENKFNLKLIDFGFSKKIKNENEKCVSIFDLAPSFRPPEILGKNPVYDEKSEIYSLGNKNKFLF